MEGEVAQFEAYRAQRQSAKPVTGAEPELPLYGGGGGDGTMDPQAAMKDYVDARDDAIESRLGLKVDKLSTKQTVWGAAGTVLVIGLAVLAFGSDRFNGGLSVSPILAQVQSEQRKTDEAQDAKLELMNQKLDILIERSSAKGAKK